MDVKSKEERRQRVVEVLNEAREMEHSSTWQMKGEIRINPGGNSRAGRPCTGNTLPCPSWEAF